MMKINNKVIYLKPYFLITRNKPLTSIYPTNIPIKGKFIVDFICVCVNNFRNDKYPQKQENLNN